MLKNLNFTQTHVEQYCNIVKHLQFDRDAMVKKFKEKMQRYPRHDPQSIAYDVIKDPINR